MMNGLTNLETPTVRKSRMLQILDVAHEKWIQEKLIPYRGICFLIPQDDRGIRWLLGNASSRTGHLKFATPIG